MPDAYSPRCASKPRLAGRHAQSGREQGIAPLPLPHHRTYRFQYPAVEVMPVFWQDPMELEAGRDEGPRWTAPSAAWESRRCATRLDCCGPFSAEDSESRAYVTRFVFLSSGASAARRTYACGDESNPPDSTTAGAIPPAGSNSTSRVDSAAIDPGVGHESHSGNCATVL